MIKASIYLRVSTRNQKQEGTSLQTQLEACLKHATDYHYQIDADSIYEEIYSGIELWERAELSKLRETIRQHRIQVLITYSIDRLSRDALHLGVILTEAEHHGVRVEFVSEPLDDSPEGQLIRFVRGYAGKIEHIKISERTQRGRLARAKSGKLIPGLKALFGYHWNADKTAYIVNEYEAAIVKQMFRLAEEGIPLRQIAKRLNQEGIRSPTGKAQWYTDSISRLLHHPAYVGRAYAYRRKTFKENGKRRSSYREETKWITLPSDVIPAIVNEATWLHIQGILQRNRELASRNLKEPEAFLLYGYAYCGTCGSKLIAGHSKGFRTYSCERTTVPTCRCNAQSSIRAHILDNEVWAEVSNLIIEPEPILMELRRRQKVSNTEQDIIPINRRIGQIERQQANLSRALAMLDDVEASKPLLNELASLAGQKRQLEQERQRIVTEQVNQEALEENLTAVLQACTKIIKFDLSYERQRQVLEMLAVKVLLYPASHQPRFETKVQLFVSVTLCKYGHKTLIGG